MVININSEPRPGTGDKYVHSKNHSDSATEIRKSNSESMKAVPDKFEKK